mgnify:FL=1
MEFTDWELLEEDWYSGNFTLLPVQRFHMLLSTLFLYKARATIRWWYATVCSLLYVCFVHLIDPEKTDSTASLYDNMLSFGFTSCNVRKVSFKEMYDSIQF